MLIIVTSRPHARGWWTTGMMRSIWRGKQPRRWQLRLLGALLFVTILPTFSFIGHWDEILSGPPDAPAPVSALIDWGAQRTEQIEHTQHCHEDLASCAAQPLPSGMGLLFTQDVMLNPPLLRAVSRPSTDALALSGRSITPTTPPPRAIS